MKAKHGPRRGPQQQISLALDAVHIRKEAGHQNGGNQQGQRNKTLVDQDHNRFSARVADGALPLAKTQTSFVLR